MQDIKPSAGSVHKAPQKSKTLNRKYTKKPTKNTERQVSLNNSSKKIQTRTSRTADIPQNASVSKFGKKPLLKKSNVVITPPKTAGKQNSSEENDAKKTSAKQTAVASIPQKSAKEKEIEKALAATPTKQKVKKKVLSKTKKRFTIWTSIFVAFFIALGIAAYFSAPNIALHIASNQAGINAKYPRELPAGFKLSESAKYLNGSVVVSFNSKDTNQNFAITQTKTKWDTTKLKDEVRKISNDNFTTTEYKGLTIFSYTLNGQNMTTWVNSDILYVISTTSNLDPSQVRTIVDGLN